MDHYPLTHLQPLRDPEPESKALVVQTEQQEQQELPKGCWGLAKFCLALLKENFRLRMQTAQMEQDVKTLRKIRESVGITREALQQMMNAEQTLRAEILGASGLEIGKDYQVHYHHKS